MCVYVICLSQLHVFVLVLLLLLRSSQKPLVILSFPLLRNHKRTIVGVVTYF